MTEKLEGSSSPADVFEAFRSSVMTALAELAQCEAIVDDDQLFSDIDTRGPTITAALSLVRSAPGRLSLVVPASLAAQLAARYLPAGSTITDDIVDDVVGEFANVIGGQAKTALKRTPYHFGMSPPVVSRSATGPIADSPSSASEPADTNLVARITLGIDIEFGRMTLEVTLPWCPEAMVPG